jgi:L-iditol 2-dehydrogenase
MKAAVLHGPDDLRLQDAPAPAVEPGRAIVRVRACGICGSDLPRILKTGMYRHPAIPGHEFMGEVVEWDQRVEDLKAGVRVAAIPLIPCGRCRWCEARMPFHCERYDFLGSRSDGGLAEFASVPVENLVRVSDAVSDEAAALMEPLAVACHCARSVGVRAGQAVVVFGAGAIGNFIAQWARALGADPVLIVDVRAEALEVARRCGLCGIDARAENVADRVARETGGLGADAVIEAAGAAAATTQAFECVRRRGTIGLIGRIDADYLMPAATLTGLLRKEIRVQGVWGFDHWAEPENDWQAAARALDAGSIQTAPLVTHRYALEKIHDALAMMTLGKEYYCKVMVLP